jgi:membrane associated rhomboid family serine protease
MKKFFLSTLILLMAGGLLPWIAFFIGQISSTVAIWAHAVGAGSVLLMMVYDRVKKREKS